MGEDSDGDAPELKTRELSLETPRVAVGIENPAAEEIPEDDGELFAFRVVVETRLEHVLDVGRIRGDDAVEDVDFDRRRRRSPEKVSVPIAEVDEVVSPARSEVSVADLAAAVT